MITLVSFAGCARAGTPARVRAPNPNGCYAVVYERPLFKGAGDIVNGPERLPSLERLPETNEANWRQRIVSMRVGPAATVTAYVDVGFKGYSRQFGPDMDQPQLEQALAGRIQSLDVACIERPGPRA